MIADFDRSQPHDFCGTPTVGARTTGCGEPVFFQRPWLDEAHVAIRCADCLVVYCVRCARVHFTDSHLGQYARGQIEKDAVSVTFVVLHEALRAGGYSAARIVERLRELGLAVKLSELHGLGLQDIANATCGPDSPPR